KWIGNVVRDCCPQARLCIDPFHVVKWATEALDVVRRELWNEIRRAGRSDIAADLKQARWALWKNPEDLTPTQKQTLGAIEKLNAPLYRAYLLKEQLRQVFKAEGMPATQLLTRWLAWASRSKLTSFVELARSIRRHFTDICHALLTGLSNARVEAMNT